MLERLISVLLNRYLGSLVRVDREQLQVGVWSGQLHLTQLEIKPSLFDTLPFTLERGMIGSFTLALNWAKMASVPVVVTISDVYCLVKPKLVNDSGAIIDDIHSWSAERLNEWLQQQKQAMLEKAFSSVSKAFTDDSGSGQFGGFAASFMASVMDNVQVHVNRVHVCLDGPGDSVPMIDDHDSSLSLSDSAQYDDDGSPFPSPLFVHHTTSSLPRYTLVMILDSLSLETTDSEGQPTFVKSAGAIVYKRVDIQGLAVYWKPGGLEYYDHDGDDDSNDVDAKGDNEDDSASDASEDDEDERFLSFMARPFHHSDNDKNHSSQSLNYLLCPTRASFQFELRKHTDSHQSTVNSLRQPMVSVTLTINRVNTEITRDQLMSMFVIVPMIAKSFHRVDAAHVLRYAPVLTPLVRPRDRESATQWWRFAYQVHYNRIHTKQQSRQWGNIVKARRDFIAYQSVYRAKLAAHRDSRPEDVHRLDQREEIESRWPLETLLTWRKLIESQTRFSVALNQLKSAQSQSHAQSQSVIGQWFGSFFIGAPSKHDSIDPPSSVVELSETERQQLISILGYDPNQPIEQYDSSDSKAFYQLTVTINEMALTFRQSQPTPCRAVLRVSSLCGEAFIHSDSFDVTLALREVGIDVAIAKIVEVAFDESVLEVSHPDHDNDCESESSTQAFARIGAQTLAFEACGQLTDTSTVTGASFECSVARLFVQDQREECAHPLFRQIVGGHKDDDSRASRARRRATQSQSLIFSTPFVHSQHTPESGSSSGRSHPSASTALLAESTPTLMPSQLRLSPAVPLPRSPLMTPLMSRLHMGGIGRPSMSLHQYHPSMTTGSLLTGLSLPPTVLPDLTIKGQQRSELHLTLGIDFSSPRLVVSSSCLGMLVRVSEVIGEVSAAFEPAADMDWNTHADASTDSDSESTTPKPIIDVEFRVTDPQLWLMADVETEDNEISVPHTLTALSSSQSQSKHLSDSDTDTDSDIDEEPVTPRKPKDQTPKSLSCLVLTCDLKITARFTNDSDVKASLSFDQLRALICYRAHHLRLKRLALPPVPIFEPLNLSVEYETVEDRSPLSLSILALLPMERIGVKLSNIDACASFLQIATAATILHALYRVIPPQWLLSKAAAAAAASVPVDPFSTAPLIAVPDDAVTFRGSVSVETGRIDLDIVNDAPGYYVPLLRFSIDPVSLYLCVGLLLNDRVPATLLARNEKLHRNVDYRNVNRRASSTFTWPFSSQSQALLEADAPATVSGTLAHSKPEDSTLFLAARVRGLYYNSEIAEWESFFDHWSLCVDGSANKYSITSHDLFALHISPTCIATLVRGLESFNQHFRPTIEALMTGSDDSGESHSLGHGRSHSEEALGNSVETLTPPRASSALPSTNPSPSPSRKHSLASPSEHGTAHKNHRNPLIAQTPTANKSTKSHTTSTAKASYFRVRNETGSRLKYWSIDETNSGGGSSSVGDSTSVTLNTGEERAVELRQYIGIDAAITKRTWLHRSPALTLAVEAGPNTDRWHGWHRISRVPLVEADANKDLTSSLIASMNEEEKSRENENIVGLTIHRLTPTHSHTATSTSNDSEVSSTWLSCRLITAHDAEGSLTRVLVVSSTFLAVNRTFVDLQLRLIDTLHRTVLFDTVLGAGHTVSLPVLVVPARRVRLVVRPAHSVGAGSHHHWDWSDNGPRVSFLRQSAYRQTTVRCQAVPNVSDSVSSSERRCFYARINVFRSTPSPINAVESNDTGDDSDEDSKHESEDENSISLPSPSSTSTVIPDHDSDDGLYTLAFDAPLSFKNMLGIELEYRALVQPANQSLPSMSLTARLPHKQEVHWYSMDLGVTSSDSVYLSVRKAPSIIANTHTNLASHGMIVTSAAPSSSRSFSSTSSSQSLSLSLPPQSIMGDLKFLSESDFQLLVNHRLNHCWTDLWSEPVLIHTSPFNEDVRVARSLAMRDQHGRPLHIALDLSESAIATHSSLPSTFYSSRIFPFAGAGPGLVTAHVPYWLFNLTGLPLVFGSLTSGDEIETSAGQDDEEVERRKTSLTLLEDHYHDDTSDEPWFEFADSKKRETQHKGIEMLTDNDDVSDDGDGCSRGWSPALRAHPFTVTPFLLSYPPSDFELNVIDSNSNNRRACIRLPNTDWSTPFSVDAVGTHGTIELSEVQSQSQTSMRERPLRMYEFGVSVMLHPNPRFHRTKTILFHPRVILWNLTGRAVQFRQVGTQQCDTLLPDHQLPLHRYDCAKPSRLSLRFSSYGWQWCARRHGIAVNEVGSQSIRARNGDTHQQAVVRIDVKLVQATFEVTMRIAWESEQRERQARMQDKENGYDHSNIVLSRGVSAPSQWSQSISPSSASSPSPRSPIRFSRINSANAMSRSVTLATPTREREHSFHGAASALLPSPPSHSHASSHVPTSGTHRPTRPRIADDDAQLNRSSQRAPASNSSAINENVPFRIENYSLHTLQFHQADEDELTERLLPYRHTDYAWDEPEGTKEIVVSIIDTVVKHTNGDTGRSSKRRLSGNVKSKLVGRYNLAKIASYPPVSVSGSASVSDNENSDGPVLNALRVSVFADGRVRVLRVEDAHQSRSGTNLPSPSLSQSLPTTTSSRSSEPVTVTVKLAGVNVSVVSHAMLHGLTPNLRLKRDPAANIIYHTLDAKAQSLPVRLDPPVTRVELLNLLVRDIDVTVSQSSDRLGLQAAIRHCQIDNQSHSAAFPVILTPAVTTSSTSKAANTASDSQSLDSSSFFVLSLVKSLEKSRENLFFFPYFSVRVAKLEFFIEEQFVAHALHFANLVAPLIARNDTSVTDQSSHFYSSYGGSRHSITGARFIDSDLVVSSAQVTQRKNAKKKHRANDTVRVHDSDALQMSGSVRRRTTMLILPRLESRTTTNSIILEDDSDAIESGSDTHHSLPSPSLTIGPSTLPITDPLLLYFQSLIIHPVLINISYSASADTHSGIVPRSHPLKFLLRALNVTLLNIDNAPLRLSSLQLEDVFASQSELVSVIRWHYLMQGTKAFYSLLGSSDLLGNPVGLFTSISSGLQSFFYEPAQGLVHSPAAFTSGIAKGTISLVQHSLYGLTNTTRGILSSLAKGLNSLTQTGSVSDARMRRLRASRSPSLGPLSQSHSFVLSLFSQSLRTSLSFVSSAADLVSSAASSISHAVNPKPKPTRIRPPKLFECGWQANGNGSAAVRQFVTDYLRTRPNEFYYCTITAPAATVSIVLTSTHMLVVNINPASKPVLMTDIALNDLLSVRGTSDGAGSLLAYEQPNPNSAKPLVQTLPLPLPLPPHLTRLLSQLVGAHPRERVDE